MASVRYTSQSHYCRKERYTCTVKPLVKDSLNKGHLCIKDTFQYVKLSPAKEDNLSIMICPNVSAILEVPIYASIEPFRST